MTRSDIIGTQPLGPLFDAVDAQRELSPEVSRAEMPGSGQAARREARERAHAKLDATYARIVEVLTAYPLGLTRQEMAEMLAMPCNTVNPRISELRALPDDDARRCITEGRRHGESIVRLARLRTPVEG